VINKTKRLVVPRVTKIPRKNFFWGATANPGRHSKESSVALLTVLRDYLRLGDKEREVTRMLNSGFIKIDGKVVKNRKTAVGFMDVITVVPTSEHFRVLYDKKGRLIVNKEDEKNSNLKPMKVFNKITTVSGKTQLILHDGQNFITEDSSISTGDVLIMSVPEKKIQHIIKMQPGNKAFLTGGAHVGSIGTIKKVEVKESSKSNLVHFEEDFTTVADYTFMIAGPKYSYEIPRGEQ
jgi:small subunit ribosomal protein S4e